jgi:hypothetical protein
VESEPFWFVAGGREFACSKFQALFVSKAVEGVMRSDNTVNRFEVDASGESFGDICSLMEGKSIVLNKNNFLSLQRIAEKIENEELLKKCFEFGVEIGKEKISVANCVEKLKIKEEFGCPIEEEIAFIASHFYGIDKEELKDLRQETIESIVSHEELCLSDEESLVEFISSLGEECRSLYGYVECCFLSLPGIETFLERIDETGIDQRLWISICRRLRCELSKQSLSDVRFCRNRSLEHDTKTHTGLCDFPYVKGRELQGMIHSIASEVRGNVHKKGAVNITSSGDQDRKPFAVANHKTRESWASHGEPGSWICFDFKDKSVGLSHYTLKSRMDHDGYHPIVWVVEGSNDEENWITLDERNTRELVGLGKMKTFECPGYRQANFFRWLRVRQTGKNSTGDHYLNLSAVEFFGVLKDSRGI